MVAAAFNRMGSVRILLSYHVELNKKDLNGNTALHIAIKNQNEEITRLLMSSGADPKIEDAEGRDSFKLSEVFATKLF